MKYKKKVMESGCFTFMQYLKHQILGKFALANKVIRLEKESIKEWAYAIHDKRPYGLAGVRALLTNKLWLETPPWRRWRSRSQCISKWQPSANR